MSNAMTSPVQKRGMLTERIKAKSLELLGYEMCQTELRLFPYLQYTMVNTQKIGADKINKEERAILSKLRNAGHIEGGLSGLRITKEFWLIMNEIILLGYVNLNA